MPYTIEIDLTERALAIIRALDPARLLAAVARGVDVAVAQTVSDIQEKRLTGEGPFPVDEGRLGVRSGRLRQSLRAVPATISGGTVSAALGSNVEYAGIHEFGGTINRTVKAGKVRLRTNRDGSLLKRGNLATFANARHKGVREVPFAGGKTYQIVIPARAPIGHGLADNQEIFEREIERALVAEMEGGAA